MTFGPKPDDTLEALRRRLMEAERAHAGVEAELERCKREIETQSARERLLAELSTLLTASQDFDSTLGDVAAHLTRAFADGCLVYLRDGDGLHLAAGCAKDEEVAATIEQARGAHAPLGTDHPVAIATRIRSTLSLSRVSQTDLGRVEPEEARFRIALEALSPRSLVVAPLVASNLAIGSIALTRSADPAFERRDVHLAEEIAMRIAISVESAQTRRALEEASRLKDEFLATVSHELRSPLSAIIGWASMLKGSAQSGLAQHDPATQRQGLETIEQSAKAQARLIEDILDVSRIVRGELRIDPEPLDLEPVLREAIETVQPAAAAKNLELRFDGCSGPCRLFGDRERLRQVFWNLLANAVKFTDPAGVVRVMAAYENGAVVVRVSDSGSGIDASLLPYVFHRFRQGKNSAAGSRSGLGLGLAIVRHLVEMHGGTVTAESAGLSQGATFTVTLPTPPFAADLEPNAPSADTGSLGGVKILVAEDVTDARDLIELVLSSEGATVCGAGSAEEALEILESFQPDVLVSDIGMPIHDGYWLVRQVHDRIPALPAVALTAFSRREDAEAAHRAGFDVHLSKPVDPSRLVEAVRLLLARPS